MSKPHIMGLLASCCLAAHMSMFQPANAQQIDSLVLESNNLGVRDLNKGDTWSAIQNFEQALRIDPSYELARKNLAIALNNHALKLRSSNVEEAIRYFHAALFQDPKNPTTRNNLDESIRKIGKDPQLFKDRLALGDKAWEEQDYKGAKVEYQIAASIETNDSVREKLKSVDEVLGVEAKSAAHSDEPAPVPKAHEKQDADWPGAAYMVQVQRAIKKAYKFSSVVPLKRAPSVVFRIQKDGSVSDVRTPHSCAVPEADEALRNAVRSAKLPPLPEGSAKFLDMEFQMNSCPTFGGAGGLLH